jgi:threonine-phosphate decarboxylase
MIQEHGGNLREISRRYGVAEDAMVDFSSNINPLGCPAAVRTILGNGLSLLSSYPDIHCAELREALAAALGCGPQNIIAGNGSTELMYLIPRAFKPRRALVLTPTFSEYEKSLLAAGCAVRSLPLQEKEQFRVRPRDVIGLLSRVDMLFLCNPNNPTGALLGRNALSEIIGAAERNGVLAVVDEAFVDFVPSHSLAREIRRKKNLMVLRSMTKFYGIPGIRLGYLVGSTRLIQQLNRFKEPWTVNALAQKIGIACAADRKFAAHTRSFVTAEREYLFSQLQSISGLQPWPSSANYLLLQITRGGLSSGAVYETLARQGILVRDCRSFKGMGNRFFRVAVKRRPDNRRLRAALKNAVGGQ